MKNQIFIFFVLVLSFINVLSSSDFLCQGSQSEDNKLKIGDNTTICIHFKETNTKMEFNIEVDKFSLFNIAGGFLLSKKIINKSQNDTQIKNKFTNMTILAQIFDKITEFPSNFYYNDNSTKEFYYPLINIVIKVEKGIIYDIVWDNNCYGCKNNNNENNGCESFETTNIFNDTITKTFENCRKKCENANDDNNLECDPIFYVTWFGTDKDKRQMKSSNMAMSKFKHYSIGSLYDNLCDAFSGHKNVDSGIIESIKTSVNDIVEKFHDSSSSISE